MSISLIEENFKRSHLTVIVGDGRMSCILFVVDYENGASFKETYKIKLPENFDVSSIDDFLGEVLEQFGEEVGWKLIDKRAGISLPLRINDKLEDGEGINSSSLIVCSNIYEEGIKSLLLGVEATELDRNLQLKGYTRYLDLLSASDMIFVNLGWEKVKVYVLTRKSSPARKDDSDKERVEIEEFEVDSHSLMKDPGLKLRSLLATPLKKEVLGDLFANVFSRKPVESASDDVKDLLRSYAMAALLNVKDDKLRRFGIETEDAHLVITGDLVGVLGEAHAVLGVVDGLQLKGRYRIAVDSEGEIFAGAAVLGKEKDLGTVLPVTDIYPRGYMYLSTEKGASGKEGKRAFTGKILFKGTEKTNWDDTESLIVAQTGQIRTFDFKEENRSGVGMVTIKPEKGVYFPNMRKEGDSLVGGFDENLKKLVVDCRKVPVVYGPDANANHPRVSEWLHQLDLG